MGDAGRCCVHILYLNDEEHERVVEQRVWRKGCKTAKKCENDNKM